MVKSLRKINIRLYIALLFMGFCPTIYTTIRTFFIGQWPGEYAYSIAGQLTWVNLVYEIVNEAVILPLFFFFGSIVKNKREFSNRIRTGLIGISAVYTVMAVMILFLAKPLLVLMAASPKIIDASATYIRIESFANIFVIQTSFVCVALIAAGKEKLVYFITAAKLLLCIVTDMFLISPFSFSAKLGINGIGISNIIVNIGILLLSIYLLSRYGYVDLKNRRMDFSWIKSFAHIGGISGLESFVRNFAYIVMVSRMVNVVGEQGTYWVANNFIWGWLLLPILQLGELIKQETAANENAVKENTEGYFTITGIVCLLWIVLLPLYKPFMKHILNYADTGKLFHIVAILLGFYVLFAFQNVFDSTFYGRGKTEYMLFESVVTNTVYYGIFFILYMTGIWIPSMTGIILMFGFGTAFDSIVSGIAYLYYRKKV